MSEDGPFILALRDCRDLAQVGGKAVNLGALLRAEFLVPDGFAITTAAHRMARGVGEGAMPPDLAAVLVQAYRKFGSPVVAVRSSATAEDLAAASMAGQFETILDVHDEAGLLAAVARCWASLDRPRLRAYAAEHGIDLAAVAVGVVVQRLVPAEVAGVLFTADPHTGARDTMVIEAAWGLGEAVVSGRVQPDRWDVDGATGAVRRAVVGDKRCWIPPGRHEFEDVAPARQTVACLSDGHLRQLWDLGRRAAAHFGRPQDLEWALAEGQLFLLQSRPITTLEDADAAREAAAAAQEFVGRSGAAGRGPWVIHNLGETLPRPTALSWSVVGRFMSGAGGFGAMYRQLGFAPSERIEREGFLDLIGGRVYMDVSRAPELFGAGWPFAYDLEALRADPSAAEAPPTLPRGSWRARWTAGRRARAAARRLRELAHDLDATLTGRLIPEFAAWCRREKARDLRELSTEDWIVLWITRRARVLDEFGPWSLLPGMIAGMALDDLRAFLAEHCWDDDAQALALQVAAAQEPDQTVGGNALLRAVGCGARPLDDWLAEWGHRGPGEFDLAAPRWRERPEQARALAAGLARGPDPLARHRAQAEAARRLAEDLRRRLPGRDRAELDRRVALAQRYLPFRENAKHELMRGYDLLRDLALEAGRRLGVGDEVFLLGEEELFTALRQGTAPREALTRRQRQRRGEKRLTLPTVLPAVAAEEERDPGAAPPCAAPTAEGLRAIALSPGRATGPARIVRAVDEAGDLGQGYVLVCPSTDPAWTPLFTSAVALVLESGGVLSHGAVVARELGLPAVVLPGATTLLRDGQVVTVDGQQGAVLPEGAARSGATGSLLPVPGPPAVACPSTDRKLPVAPRAGPRDVRIAPALIPPPPGRRERAAGRWALAGLLVWGVYLLAVFALPAAALYQPTLARFDALLWPAVRALGRPGVTALVAAALAVLTMAAQRWLTDNGRLREAKRRAAELGREAAALPADAPRRRVLARLAAPVAGRVLAAALVPLALLLGPMVMSFLWLQERMPPANWNAPPGAAVTITALVDSACRQPVRIEVAEPLHLDLLAPAAQRVPPVRETLERLLAHWPAATQPANDLPWQIAKADAARRERLHAELTSYLQAGVPPQALAWRVFARSNAAGRFVVHVQVDASDAPAHGRGGATIPVVLGDQAPPGAAEVAGPTGSPVRLLKVQYPPPARHVFWAPWAGKSDSPLKVDWDVGWLGVYLLAYLPVMLTLRWRLGVA